MQRNPSEHSNCYCARHCVLETKNDHNSISIALIIISVSISLRLTWEEPASQRSQRLWKLLSKQWNLRLQHIAFTLWWDHKWVLLKVSTRSSQNVKKRKGFVRSWASKYSFYHSMLISNLIISEEEQWIFFRYSNVWNGNTITTMMVMKTAEATTKKKLISKDQFFLMN